MGEPSDGKGATLPGLGGLDHADALRSLEALFKCAEGYVVYRLRKLPLQRSPLGAEVEVVSPSIRDVMGVQDPEDLGTWFNLVHPDDLPRVMAAQLACHQDDEPFDEIFRFIVDGEIRFIQARSHPVFDTAGRATHFNGLVLDVTERVKAEQEVETLRGQVGALQRLESLGTLAASAAHDFNNLLQGITMTLDMARRAQPEAVTASLLGEIDEQVERGALLTRDLLAFARRDRSDPTPEDVRPHVERVVRLALRLHPELDLETELPTTAVVARIGPGELEQILMNLVINAAQATGGSGHVSVSVRRCSSAEATDLAGLPVTEPMVVIEVSDDGPAVPPDVLPLIFETGYTTKSEEGGTGLGLTTVRRLAERRGGLILVEQDDGKVFRCLLPLASSRAVAPAAHPVRPGRAVLLVDDDASARRGVADFLTAEGYDVREADSYAEALMHWHRGAEDFGWLVTDTVVPGRGGLELIRQLRATSPQLAVVLVSGDLDETSLSAAVHDPSTALLPKPFEGRDLTETLRALDPARAV